MPLFAEFSQRLLRPLDRFVACCARCSPEKCEVQYMDTGVMSGAPSPNNYEVRCNALEEGGKASPDSPVAGIGMTVESDSGMIRRWLLGSYLVVAAAILITCYYFHLFAATSDLGTPSPLHCRSTFFRYNTAIGGSSCGLWGEECLPSTWMPIRCPALCGYSLHDALDTRPYALNPLNG
eukprot:symbB.v1.2.010217.t1/scaffold665.1/size175136/8